jgi:hypothetical protein
MSRLLLLLPLLLVSCAALTPLPPKPSHREPTKKAKLYKPTSEWIINNASDLETFVDKLGATVTTQGSSHIVNLNGGIIDGSKQKGDGGQSENQTPLFRARIPLIVKNGFIKNNKNAATFYAPDSGVEFITWLNVGEDGVATAEGAKDFRVIGCEFINSKDGDKSIQLNEADGARIERNMVYSGITGIRVGKIDYSETKNKAYCGNNTFVGVDTAFNVAKVQLYVQSKNNFKGVRIPYKVTRGASIKNPDSSVENY